MSKSDALGHPASKQMNDCTLKGLGTSHLVMKSKEILFSALKIIDT